MATLVITNDPSAILAPSPGSITLISESFQQSPTMQLETMAEAYALADTLQDGTFLYVVETDCAYLKGATGLRPFVLSE